MPESPNLYGSSLDRNPANYVPLSPLGFLARSAATFPDRLAVVHGRRRYRWAETYARCRQLASALSRRGVGKNDTVAVMATNTPEALEAHFGVPMTGAVLNALNIRLDAAMIAFILGHGEAKVLITDREFSPVIEKALALLKRKPLVIDIDDALAPPDAFTAFEDAYAISSSNDSRTPVAVQATQTARNSLSALVRAYSRPILANGGVLDADKLALGLVIRDTHPTAIPAPGTSPVVALVGQRPQLTLTFRDQGSP